MARRGRKNKRETSYASSPWTNLANAIVVQAAVDYKNNLRKLKREPGSISAMREVGSINRFWDSEWYKQLTNIDASYLKEQIISNI